MRKKLLFIALFFLLGVLPLTVCAADAVNSVFIGGMNTETAPGKKLPIDAVSLFRTKDGSYCLFLPSYADASNRRVFLTGGLKSIKVNGVTLQNGDLTDVFIPGTNVSLTIGKNKYTVSVIQSKNVATVYLNTKSGGLRYLSQRKNITEDASLMVIDEAGKLSFHFQDEVDYVRLRGNYSFGALKKSFHIKLKNKVSMLGMDKSKTWLLLANYNDNSLIRDAVAFDLGEGAHMPFTIDYRFCDLYLNNAYYGTFMLSEKVQVGKNRVNIEELEEATAAVNSKPLDKCELLGMNSYKPGTYKYYNIKNDPADITGGYLIQLEMSNRYMGSDAGFVTNSGQPVLIKEPDHPTKAQVMYIRALVQAFENAIEAPDGIDPESGKHYSEIADMDSMVNKYLVDEITKNLDANKTSFYLYKDSDDINTRLFFGPLWDYDHGLGVYSSDKYEGITNVPEGLFAGVKPGAEKNREVYYFFPKLYAHEDFVEAVKKAYKERFRPQVLVLLGDQPASKATGRTRSLDDWEAFLTPTAAMNFTLRFTFKQLNKDFPVRTGSNYAETIVYIREFLRTRLEYLDSIWLD